MPFTLLEIVVSLGLLLLLQQAFLRAVRWWQGPQTVLVLELVDDTHCILHCYQSTRDGRKVIHSTVDLTVEERVLLNRSEKAWLN